MKASDETKNITFATTGGCENTETSAHIIKLIYTLPKEALKVQTRGRASNALGVNRRQKEQEN